ncbi:N-acyl homoserine lactonase family protein [Pseudonocardia lutea]|uniref:N-acyl homoserine lactonase family protein n=1 Tax=Pseudonocardia lutea TaxID=2172015 RepID=A0ABW1HZP8_9PSEU
MMGDEDDRAMEHPVTLSGPGSDGTTGPEVIAVRYGTRQTTRSDVYLNFHHYGVPDSPIGMDYFFWIVRNGGRTVVVDTGFSDASGARRGRTMLCHPRQALVRLGVDPMSVDQVLVSHAHYDHIGNLDLFPAAEVVIARAEYDFWTGPYANRFMFAMSAEQDEVTGLRGIAKEGRLTFVEGTHSANLGIEIVEVGGHTPGQTVAVVATAAGPVILASDAVHYYEELELDRPFMSVADLQRMYRAFDQVSEMAEDSGAVLVAGHDPLVGDRFTPYDAADPGFALRIR